MEAPATPEVKQSLPPADHETATKPEVEESQAPEEKQAESPGVALKQVATPVFNKLPLLAQDKFATPPSGKAGTPPLPRANPVLTERNKDVDARRPNALQLPPKNFLRHQERYMSPTDTLVSPISKGLLLRNRRPVRMAAPMAPPKALETSFENENSLSRLNL